MFIVIQTYGTKLAWNNSHFSTLRVRVATDLRKSVNINYLIYSKSYVDIRKETILLLGRVH